jgi:hypothetical protein
MLVLCTSNIFVEGSCWRGALVSLLKGALVRSLTWCGGWRIEGIEVFHGFVNYSAMLRYFVHLQSKDELW